jgi:leucyl aminopeptidase
MLKITTVDKKNIIHLELQKGQLAPFIQHHDDMQRLMWSVTKLPLSAAAVRLEMRKIVRHAPKSGTKELAVDWQMLRDAVVPGVSDEELLELLVVESSLGAYDFVLYKSKPVPQLGCLRIIGMPKKYAPVLQRAILLAEATTATRELCNNAANDLTPDALGRAARAAVRGLPVRVQILGLPDLRRLRMGGILGVAKGSAVPPRLIVIEYRGGKKNEAPVVLVGKGVTFDSGGINLKPSNAMIAAMHLDMSGGAAVIHALALAAKQGLKKNIIAIIPAVENMPSGTSYRPGDILRSMSGRTIEVANTDAEGRIILADALTYASRYKPAVVLTLATLTGAAMVALGTHASAFMTTSRVQATRLRRAGKRSGDPVWRLPLWPVYAAEMKSEFADLTNSSPVPYGGAMQAAAFLQTFAKDLACPFVHVDIAPRMLPAKQEHLAPGATGVGVRLLYHYLVEGR